MKFGPCRALPGDDCEQVTPKLLKAFFWREDGTYRVASDLREVCLFSAHNLLRDPPFSKLDLIACRNLPVYMGPELQEKIVPIFRYALRSAGHLFLVSSGNVTRHARLSRGAMSMRGMTDAWDKALSETQTPLPAQIWVRPETPSSPHLACRHANCADLCSLRRIASLLAQVTSSRQRINYCAQIYQR
ncbi:hypothetical protein MPLB_2040027 [Mesorhizobium sp. ORS 3324]|nr:hypothetical protein MPLB_2040027 [Mesorhizobium sp. ORS 3324]